MRHFIRHFWGGWFLSMAVQIANRSIKLLFVSGSREDRQKVQATGASLGAEVRTASGYREGVVALCHYLVDAIVCDDALPDGDWKDFLSLIAPFTSRPRLVVCSNTENEIRAEMMELGGFAVLEKPLVGAAVARTICAIAHEAESPSSPSKAPPAA